jgi:hypothetical protein
MYPLIELLIAGRLRAPGQEIKRKDTTVKTLNDHAFARPIPFFPDFLEAKLTTSAVLSDEEDDLYTRICGVAPGFPEAFASATARDAALGPFGPYVQFVEASWTQAEAAGFPISSVAIGHALRDEGFAEVAPEILDAVANCLQEDDGHDIIINRTRYIIRATDGIIRACRWVTEFDGTPIADDDAMATVEYLTRELNQRLATATR